MQQRLNRFVLIVFFFSPKFPALYESCAVLLQLVRLPGLYHAEHSTTIACPTSSGAPAADCHRIIVPNSGE